MQAVESGSGFSHHHAQGLAQTGKNDLKLAKALGSKLPLPR